MITRYRDTRGCLTTVGGTRAVYSFFGSGCRGSAGVPGYAASGVPVLNSRHLLTVTNARAFAPVTFFFGTSRTNWSGLRLPFDLGILGATNCNLYVSGEFQLSTLASSSGTAAVQVTLGNDVSLVGKDFQTQVIVRDRRANALGLVTTRAATGTVGDTR